MMTKLPRGPIAVTRVRLLIDGVERPGKGWRCPTCHAKAVDAWDELMGRIERIEAAFDNDRAGLKARRQELKDQLAEIKIQRRLMRERLKVIAMELKALREKRNAALAEIGVS